MTAHPWRRLRDRHPRIEIQWHRLAGSVAGYWDGAGCIVIDPRLTQAARRSVLRHELAHVERGVIPINPVLAAREEAIVDEIAARDLIPLDRLIDALRWSRGVAGHDVAEEVWTDLHTVGVRLATLTEAERAEITDALADDEWAA